jgi:hypothetical protein
VKTRIVPLVVVLALSLTACAPEAEAPPTTPPAPATAETRPPAAPSRAATVAQASEHPLEGSWVTAPTTCAEQNAALTKAGFIPGELKVAGWDPATCMDMSLGKQFRFRFTGDRMRIYQDGAVGWDGTTRFEGEHSFKAGDKGTPYITFDYELAGDELRLDMRTDDYPTQVITDLLADGMVMTVLSETAPFTREAPAAAASAGATPVTYASTSRPYTLTLPAGWLANNPAPDDAGFESADGRVSLTIGSGELPAGQTVEDRVRINRTEEFQDCATDPSTDRAAEIDGEKAILWTFHCGSTAGLAASIARKGNRYRLTLKAADDAHADLEAVMAQLIQGFHFTD